MNPCLSQLCERSPLEPAEGTIHLFGVRMHAWTVERSIKEIDARLRSSKFTQHVVVNVAKLVNMRSDLELRAAVEGCDIVNIDGAGVVLGGRLLGYSIPERVAGIDLFYELLAYSERSRRSVYFLGARPDLIEAAVLKIRVSYPDLRIAGYHHGYFWDDESEIVEKIRRSGADLLFVGISSPMKERFINKWKGQLGVKFARGVGGTFDIVAGKTKRAPYWMQRAGLEWFFRIIQEPRLMFMRYAKTNSVFAWMLLIELIRRPAR